MCHIPLTIGLYIQIAFSCSIASGPTFAPSHTYFSIYLLLSYLVSSFILLFGLFFLCHFLSLLLFFSLLFLSFFILLLFTFILYLLINHLLPFFFQWMSVKPKRNGKCSSLNTAKNILSNGNINLKISYEIMKKEWPIANTTDNFKHANTTEITRKL